MKVISHLACMPSQTVLDFRSNVCGGILFHFVFKAHKLKQLLPIKTEKIIVHVS
jgi:hypothetical protein